MLCALLITECMWEAKWVGGLESCALLFVGEKRRRMDAAGPCDLRDDLGLKENESITAVPVDMGDSAEAWDTVY